MHIGCHLFETFMCNSTEIQHTTPLRTYSPLFQVVCLYSHPSQQIQSARVSWVTWLGLSISSRPEKILSCEYILTRHCSIHGSAALSVLCCSSLHPWYCRDFPLKYRQGNGNVTGGLVLALVFKALLSLHFEISIWWAPYEFHLLWHCFVSVCILVISSTRRRYEAFQRGQSCPRALQVFVYKNERSNSYNG